VPTHVNMYGWHAGRVCDDWTWTAIAKIPRAIPLPRVDISLANWVFAYSRYVFSHSLYVAWAVVLCTASLTEMPRMNGPLDGYRLKPSLSFCLTLSDFLNHCQHAQVGKQGRPSCRYKKGSPSLSNPHPHLSNPPTRYSTPCRPLVPPSPSAATSRTPIPSRRHTIAE
jgi:hypothetical protein